MKKQQSQKQRLAQQRRANKRRNRKKDGKKKGGKFPSSSRSRKANGRTLATQLFTFSRAAVVSNVHVVRRFAVRTGVVGGLSLALLTCDSDVGPGTVLVTFRDGGPAQVKVKSDPGLAEQAANKLFDDSAYAAAPPKDSPTGRAIPVYWDFPDVPGASGIAAYNIAISEEEAIPAQLIRYLADDGSSRLMVETLLNADQFSILRIELLAVTDAGLPDNIRAFEARYDAGRTTDTQLGQLWGGGSKPIKARDMGEEIRLYSGLRDLNVTQVGLYWIGDGLRYAIRSYYQNNSGSDQRIIVNLHGARLVMLIGQNVVEAEKQRATLTMPPGGILPLLAVFDEMPENPGATVSFDVRVE